MISKRIITMFLLKGKRLVKGTRFKDFIDVGDPVSQGMIYDAQGADEIVIVDIEASKNGHLINTAIITDMISKCRLPIAAGGGIKTLSDARKCFNSGADKIVINSQAAANSKLIKELAEEFGSQSVLVSIDVRRNADNSWDVYTYSGERKINTHLEDYIRQAIDLGAGEIMITSIDKEGTLEGFDFDLYKKIDDIVTVPLIASGGAGSYDDMVSLFKGTNCDACALGKILFLRDFDIVRIKAYLEGRKVFIRES